jgi:dUTP pyrophosphatase
VSDRRAGQDEGVGSMMGCDRRYTGNRWENGVGEPEHVPVAVRRIDGGLPVPSYAHPGDAGADLCAAVDVRLPPGGRALVPTGVAIALPAGYVGLVHPRSGLAHRMGVTVLNAPGTVDAGYRGEIMVNLINHDREVPATITRGDRIAQLVVQRVCRADFEVVAELPDSARGAGGHGSTGGHAALSAAAPAGPVASERAMEGTA